MNEKNQSQFSRLIATADSLGEAAQDRHRFVDKPVLLTGESEILAAANGRQCFLDCVRLLMRMIRSLTICVPDSPNLEADVEAMIKALSHGPIPSIQTPDSIKFDRFEAILSVGSSGRGDLPWTVVNSNGWTARVSSNGRSLSSDVSQPNPVGALGAACLGSAEIFKRLIRLKPERGRLHDMLVFSFFSYACEADPGPLIPEEILLDLLLVGAGAIGNGTIHLLRSLPIKGEIKIVDNQTFGEENWGTCILVGPKDLGESKARVAEKWLETRIKAKGFPETIDSFREWSKSQSYYPKLILNGLDNIPARRSIQEFWPDQIIDGAISPTACEVTLHPWGPDLACLQCDFEEPQVSSLSKQIQATGLKAERLVNQTLLVNDDDIKSAPPEKRAWLQQQKGRDICSVVSEGILAQISEEKQNANFRPSVPFVAALSSCMIVSELFRYFKKSRPVLETGFQFDVMVGPQLGGFKSHARKPQCICVTKRSNIEILRQRWFGKA